MHKKIILILFVIGLSFFFIFQRDVLVEDDPQEKEIPEEEIKGGNDVITEDPEEKEDVDIGNKKENNLVNEKEPEDITTEEESEFISCLEEKGVIIYGSAWCPLCKQLVEDLGGYDVVDPIYVECTQERDRCREEMIGTGVPEIQIQGEVYRESRDPEKIAEETSCKEYY